MLRRLICLVVAALGIGVLFTPHTSRQSPPAYAQTGSCTASYYPYFVGPRNVYCQNIASIGKENGNFAGATAASIPVARIIDAYEVYAAGDPKLAYGSVCLLGPPLPAEMQFVFVSANQLTRRTRIALEFTAKPADFGFTGFDEETVAFYEELFPGWYHYCAFVPEDGQVALLGKNDANRYFEDYSTALD